MASKAVIEEFQKIVDGSEILGAKYENPYTKKIENFPSNPSEFNSKHLQILARNESLNTTGVYNFNLYGGLLDEDKICRIRHLQKLVVNQSEVKAEYCGGFPSGQPKQIQGGGKNFFLVDQSGFQWQGDKRNTGCIFFYPENATDQSYDKFQKDMYRVTFQEDRPDQPSENKIAVTWNGDRGVIDLDLLRKGFKEEFKQAFISANHAFSQDKSGDKHCLRFNKAGLGFFAEGVINDEGGNKKIKQDKFYEARLEGIAEALGEIHQSAQNGQGDFIKSPKFDALELPYSADQRIFGYDELDKSIKDNAKKIGIGEVFIGNKDALEVKPGYKVALTNCADPHAMVGNEGNYGSVDAMIATNCGKSSQNVNVAYNQNFVELSYDPKSSSISITNSNSSVVAVNDNYSSQNFEPNPVTSQSPTAVLPEFLVNRGDYIRKTVELEDSKNKLKDLIKKFNWNPVTEAYQKGDDGARWMEFKSKSIEEKDVVIGEYGLTKNGEKSIVLDLRRDNSRLGTRFDSQQFYFLDNGEISIAGKKTENGKTEWTNNLERRGGVIDPVLCKFYIDQACTYIEKNILKSDPKALFAPTATEPETSVSVNQGAKIESTLREVTEELAKNEYIFPQQRGWIKLGYEMETGLNSRSQKSYANSDHQLIIEDGGRVVVLDKKQLDENQNFSVVSDSSKRLQVMEGFLEKINELGSGLVGEKVINIIRGGDRNPKKIASVQNPQPLEQASDTTNSLMGVKSFGEKSNPHSLKEDRKVKEVGVAPSDISVDVSSSFKNLATRNASVKSQPQPQIQTQHNASASQLPNTIASDNLVGAKSSGKESNPYSFVAPREDRKVKEVGVAPSDISVDVSSGSNNLATRNASVISQSQPQPQPQIQTQHNASASQLPNTIASQPRGQEVDTKQKCCVIS